MISSYPATGRSGRVGFASAALGVCALALVAFGFYFVGFGFDVNDEAYQTMNAMAPHVNPQAILASAVSNIFGRLFGFSLYSMRILTFSLTVLSVGLAAAYYYRVRRDAARSLLLFILVLAASLCTPTKSRLIGWDCYAVFFTTLSMLSVVELWRGGGWRCVALLGFSAACATLSRFPDVVIVPVAVAAMFGNADGGARAGFRRVALFLLIYLAAMVVMLGLIYDGDPLRWVVSLRENLVSGHNAGRLVDAYIHTGRLDMLDIALLSGFLFFVCHCSGKTRMVRVAFLSLCVVLLVVLFLKMDRMYYTVCRLLTASVVIPAAVYASLVCGYARWRQVLRAFVLIGFCVVPMAGSDGGTTKFMNLTSIPVCLLLLSDVAGGKAVVAMTKRLVWCVLAVIGVAMPFFTARHTTFDGGWADARSEVGHVLLRGNTTTCQRAGEINEMLAEGRRVLPDSALILGHNNRRFFSEYLWGSRNELWPHSWSDRIFEDEEKVSLLADAIRSGAVRDIVFVTYGANDHCDFEDNPMRRAIEATGEYRVETYKWFIVFRRVPGAER